MLYCRKCGFHLTGSPECCPFCRGELEGECQEEVFPRIPDRESPYKIFMMFLTLGMAAALAVCITINLVLPQSGSWWMFVAAGLFSGWIAVAIALKKRGNLLKLVLWQVCAVSLLVLLWDWWTGFWGWSVSFVLPILYTFTLFVLSAAVVFLRLSAQDYLFYLLWDILLGGIPLTMLLCGAVRIALPSLICVACSLLFLLWLAMFRKAALKEELARRLHL